MAIPFSFISSIPIYHSHSNHAEGRCSSFSRVSQLLRLAFSSDPEYEEERGCSSEEETKDERRTDTGTKGYVGQRNRHACIAERLVKDLTELDLPSTMKTHFPDPADLLNFTLTITPDEGVQKNLA